MYDRVKRLTEVLKSHDRALYASRSSNGMIQVWRQADRWEASLIPEGAENPDRPCPQFILPLTDNFKLNGKPVEWGLDPLLRMIQSMDSWSQEDILGDVTKTRESEKRVRERSRNNDIRARAYDMRREFARSFNDINTSTLAKPEQKIF